jgi:CheY-like chemotaxis protein
MNVVSKRGAVMGMVVEDTRRQATAKGRAAVLIVEDEVLVRAMVAEEFRSAGYVVIEAVNADEAVEVLRHDCNVQLVISDLRMPGSLDGTDLARLLRAEYSGIKIILSSGNSSAVDWVDHDGFFRKPYNFKALIGHVRTLLR